MATTTWLRKLYSLWVKLTQTQPFHLSFLTSKVITSSNTNEELIKKSTFVGVCFHTDTPEKFFHSLTKFQDLTATHNCWAYRIGNEYRFNDDGEPSGTAGKPILAAIEGAGFDYIGALVIRYYGGIKLGTGGLARAYGGTIAKNLQNAPFKEHVPLTTLMVQIPFEHSQQLFKVTADFNGQTNNQEFNVSGMQCEVTLPVKELHPFKASLQNISKGQVKFTDLNP